MKVFIILIVSCCISIPSKIVNADIGSDIDFELYKHLDVSPIHTSYDHDVDDFDDDHTTFDSTYDGGGLDIHDNDDTDDDVDDNNQNGDVEKSKKSDENNANVNDVKKNSADYDNNNNNDDNDDGENNEGTENDDPNENEEDDDDDNEEGGDDNDDDDDEEEKGDESRIEATTIKAIDPKGTETVDPESFHYISPTDVSHRLSREKRSKKTDKSNTGKDYDFAQSYREFVREHFGVDDAQTLSDNKKKKEKKQDYDDENDNGEVEEDEDYEEGAGDGETSDDDDSNKSGTTASAPADDYYDDDDGDNNDDNDDDTQDDDYDNDSSNISDEDEDYKKVKKLSQDTDENPEFCKTVYKDNQECQVCRNPKTKDKSETCSYSSSPSPKRYAYKKEKNYNSNDDFGDPEDGHSESVKPKKKSKKSKAKKHKSEDFDDDYSNSSTHKKKPKSKSKSKKHAKKNKRSKENTESKLTEGFQPSYPYYHNYQDRRTTTPLQNHYFGDSENDDLSFRASESLPVTASSETYDSDVDIFKGRDWSQCSRKINKEGLTCYYCKDAHGATQEECMYIAGNDDDSPLRGKTKKHTSNKKVKKIKRNHQSNRKSSIVTTTISSNRITTPTTTTRTTSIPKIITTTLRPYDTKNTNFKPQEDLNKFNTNTNTAPSSSVSSVSWQTNHNYQLSPHQQPRILNRNQNFAITNVPIPILRQNINNNPLRITVPYGSSTGSELNIPKTSDPVKTLEYTEPRNRETLKRMIKLRITNDHDSDKLPSSNLNADNDATVFYSKVLRKF